MYINDTLSFPVCVGTLNNITFPTGTDLSLRTPWGPSGGLHQRRDRCSERRQLPLPRSPQAEEVEGEQAPQTHLCPLGEVEEAELDCLLLEHKKM